MTVPHISVLLSEVLSIFNEKTLRVFVDGTLGAGGHAAALLEAHPEIELFIGIDQDPLAIETSSKLLAPWKEKVRFISGNFGDIKKILKSENIEYADGILLDLGVSSMQLGLPEKGFSFLHDGPLDMRMDPNASLTAADIVNMWSERDLGRIFRDYGEEKAWRAAARTIVSARENAPILTTAALAEVLRPVLSWKKRRINPLTLIFQALRICVNREIEILEETLPQIISLLSPQGRLAVISFHSLEDRIVKNAFRYGASDKLETFGIGSMFRNKEQVLKILTKKPICPSEKEVSHNPRSRSAKLRAVEKI